MAKLSWRSKFWNTVLTIVMGSFCLLSIIPTYDEMREPEAIHKFWGAFFAAQTLIFLVGTIRAPFVGVTATAKGISIHHPMWTRHVPWREVSDIRMGNLSTSAAGTMGAQAPIVYRETAEEPKKPVVVKELGSYLTGEGDSLAEKSTSELRQYLHQVRAHQQ